MDLNSLIEAIKAQSSISDQDVQNLRRAVFGDGAVSLQEADAVFELNDLISDKASTWNDFYMEGMTDFIVRQASPYGYIDASNAEWLIKRIGKDGIVETITELSTLVNIVKTAKTCPDSLISFTLSQITNAVLHEQGVIGRGRTLSAGVIGAAETELLRDVLYACGGDNRSGISRQEAEVLFDLNDACQSGDNDPAWRDLFVKGIANYLMVLTTFETPDRKEALRREDWLLSERKPLSSLGQLKFKDIGREMMNLIKGESTKSTKADLAGNSAVYNAESINSEEAAWLISRINKNAELNDNEKALMRFLEAESPYLHVSLSALLSDASRAA